MADQYSNNYQQALSKMQVLCSKSEKCSGDIFEKLKKYPLSEIEKNKIIEELKNEEFIDDKRYVSFYCRDKFKFNHWGKLKMQQSLRNKFITEDIIESELQNIDISVYSKKLEHLLKEKNKNIKDENLFSRKGKLFRYAASKGFESDLIYKQIEEIINS